jgi:hypothetical protein
MKYFAAFFALSLSLASTFALADVEYHQVLHGADDVVTQASYDNKIVRTGFWTREDGSVYFLIYIDNSVAASCGADVKSVSDAIELDRLIRQYSVSESVLRVRCESFQSSKSTRKGTIALMFPTLK